MPQSAYRGDVALHAVTPYGTDAGSSRVRIHEWVQRLADPVCVHPYAGLSGAGPLTLARHGARVLAAEQRLRRLARGRPGRLLLHREASPLSRGSLEVSLLRAATASVYDFDDALYTDVGAGPFYRRLAPKADKTLAAVRAADRVVVGNTTLANWAADHHRDVVIIPSCVDPAAYEAKTSYELGAPPRLGWIGSWSTEEHLRSIALPLLRLHRRTGARLIMIGAPTGDLGVLAQMTDRVPWSLAVQRAEVARFDIGLMPLIDTAYARGKCGYKLLQYLAVGVPSVASPVGVNAEILGRAGMPAASTDEEWEYALNSLLDLPADERAASGNRARAVVDEHYSFAAWQDRWRTAMFLDAV